MKKKKILLGLLVASSIACLASCGSSNKKKTDSSSSEVSQVESSVSNEDQSKESTVESSQKENESTQKESESSQEENESSQKEESSNASASSANEESSSEVLDDSKYKITKEAFESFFKEMEYNDLIQLNYSLKDIVYESSTDTTPVDTYYYYRASGTEYQESETGSKLYREFYDSGDYLYDEYSYNKSTEEWDLDTVGDILEGDLFFQYPFINIDYSKLTYNESDKSYSVSDVNYELFGNSYTATNIKIYFENNVIKKISYDPGTDIDQFGVSHEYHVIEIFDIGKTQPVNIFHDDIDNFYISVEVEGNGTATGEGDYNTSETPVLVATPNEGNEFVGWYLKGEEVSTDPQYTVELQEDATFVAKFRKITVVSDGYSVTYNANGGEGSVDKGTANSENKITLSQGRTISRESSTLLGWSTDKDATKPEYELGEEITLSSDVELYAIWLYNYSLTYDLNGTSYTYFQPNPAKTPDNKYKALNVNYNYYKYGYYLAGWSTNKFATQPDILQDEVFYIKEDTVLYAVWKEAKYVTCYANGGEGSTKTVYADEYNQVHLNASAFTNEGKSLIGWSTNPSAAEPTYAPSEVVTISDNAKLYAIWGEGYKITCKFIGIDKEDKNYTTNAEGMIHFYSDPGSSTLYRCYGIALSDNEDEIKYQINQDMYFTKDTTLYFFYIRQYKITYYSEPKGISSKITVKYADEFSDYDVESDIYTKDNYTLYAWEDADGLNYDLGETTYIEGDLDLYAWWEGDFVDINYINNLEEDYPDLFSLIYDEYYDDFGYSYYGEYITLPTTDFLYDTDLTLIGWTSQAYEYGVDTPTVEYEAGETYFVDSFNITDGVLELYPCFEGQTYTYSTTRIEPTLEEDGKIIYTCNEDSSKSYEEVIKKDEVFAFYYSDIVNNSTLGLTILVGDVVSGTLYRGDTVSVSLADGSIVKATVEHIESFRKEIDSCKKGDNVGLYVDIDVNLFKSGNSYVKGGLVASEDKIIMSNEVLLDVRFYTTDEGGRTTAITSSSYRPAIYYGNTIDVTATLTGFMDYSKTSQSTINPGDSGLASFSIIRSVPIWVGSEVYIRESGRTVAIATVVARNEAQTNDLLNNKERVTINFNSKTAAKDIEKGYTLTKSIYVNRNTQLKDIYPVFERPGFVFKGYYSSPTVSSDNALAQFNLKTINDVKNTTIYQIWERTNDTECDFYITAISSYSGKGGQDYTSVTTDEPIGKTFKTGDTVTVYRQDGTSATVTIKSIYWYNSNVTEVNMGSSHVVMYIGSSSLASTLSIGDVIKLEI